ncbi:hypothetical protein ACEZCY_14015 [Streptacidiphilus sp. N1-12]|uniref:Uncharacterized protein n=2 Tax=Streptacidiphilus alkalitolerans TaxID=3342712 RepID=A0ABV6WEA2_9ACTN
MSETTTTIATTVVDAPQNLRTHTATVHAPGRYNKRLRTNVPACCTTGTAVARLHYLAPTTEAVTCKRCLNRTAK